MGGRKEESYRSEKAAGKGRRLHYLAIKLCEMTPKTFRKTGTTTPARATLTSPIATVHVL